MQHTYPKVNIWRKTNYIEAERLLKNDMPQRDNKERHKQSKDTNQNNPTMDPTSHMDTRYYEMSEGVF